MRILSLITIAFFWSGLSFAQTEIDFVRADSSSYKLYQEGRWKDLLQFGKNSINAGQDFILLRLRMGFAAYSLKNYSEAILHYTRVLKEDRYNETAHYFIYWSRINLGQPQIAMASVVKTSAKDIPASQRMKTAFESVNAEVSIKNTDLRDRGNAFYARAGFGHRLSHSFHLEHQFSHYNQIIAESGLESVSNNNRIRINQVEYYNRMLINLSSRWQLKAAWHYVRTPFNNYVYDNNLVLGGFKYYGTYANFQADLVWGKITDTNNTQINLELQWFPFGNMDLYGYSTGMIRTRGETSFLAKQVIGIRVIKNLWVEGNFTSGPFSNLVENDALYLYHAIDPNRFKTGAGIYLLRGGMILQIGYGFEQRERFGTGIIFNQHAINGGISWKL